LEQCKTLYPDGRLAQWRRKVWRRHFGYKVLHSSALTICHLRERNRGAAAAEPAPILDRLHASEGCPRVLHDFSRLFHRRAGTLTSPRRAADKRGATGG
jgi:hypothetical protein